MFVAQAVLVSLVFPPWQDADSPTHFVLVRALTMPDRTADARLRLEADVIQSMARHRWWEPYELSTPDPLPTTFREMEFGRGTYGQPLYYALGAGVLTMTRPGGVEAAYWHLRMLSIVMSAATLAMAWAGTRLMFGPAVALGVTAVAALYPQFLLASIAVNPNVLAALWGALAWWQIGRVIGGRRPEISLALIVVAAVAAALTKRSAAPFSIAAVLVAGELFRREAPRWGARKSGLALAVVAAPLFVGAAVAAIGQGGALVTYWRSSVDMLAARTWSLSEAPAYALENIDNTWFIAGWHRYVAPEPWRAAGRLLTLGGVAGSLVWLVRPPAARLPVVVACVLVAAQILVVLAAGLWGFLVPHGRYAETVLAPMALLLWLGCDRLFRPVAGRYAGAVLVSGLAVMDAGLISGLLIPAYLPW